MEEEYKACPFCGSLKLKLKQVYTRSFVKCRECYAQGPVRYADEAAERAWNVRSGESEEGGHE